MMHEYRQIAFVCVMTVGLILAACDDLPDDPGVPAESTNPPVSEQQEISVAADVTAQDKPKPDPAADAKPDQVGKPLDLSLPPQPARVAPRPAETAPDTTQSILPDLFELEQEPQDDRAMRLKGQVLMEEGTEKSLDSMEGGQIMIEMNTR